MRGSTPLAVVFIVASTATGLVSADHKLACFEEGTEGYYPPAGSGDEGHLYCEGAGTGASYTSWTDDSDAETCVEFGTALPESSEFCVSASIGGYDVVMADCTRDPNAHAGTARDRDCFAIEWGGGAATDRASSGDLQVSLPRTNDGDTPSGGAHESPIACEWYLIYADVNTNQLPSFDDPAYEYHLQPPVAVAGGPPYGCQATGSSHHVTHGPQDVWDASATKISNGDGLVDLHHMALALGGANEISACTDEGCVVPEECTAAYDITPLTLINDCIEAASQADEDAGDDGVADIEAHMSWSFHWNDMGDMPAELS